MRNFLKRFDFPLILMVLTLVVFGIIFIYSSGFNSSGVLVTNFYIKQIIWACIGLVLMIAVTLYDYRKVQSVSLYLYIFLIALLVYTRIFGRYVNGAKSWIGIGDFGIQPSEFGKIIFIFFLSKFFADNTERPNFQKFLISLGILVIPLGLILIQPDMGTASVYIPIYLFICFLAGISIRYLAYLLLFGGLSIVFAILPYWNQTIPETPYAIISILTNYKLMAILISAMGIIAALGFVVRRYFHGPSYIYWITYIFSAITLALLFSLVFRKVLKNYQILRLIVFMNPLKDGFNGRGAGWNIIQSKVAIGSGGLVGKGYLNGSQSHLRYLPEQHTDFIFGIIAEELGFFGGIILFILYSLILFKIILTIKRCSNNFGVYIAAGIFGMFSFHFFVNVGMVMGIMPITGIPLLFVSYGGSSLLTAMMCIGIVMNISYRQKQFMSISG